MSFFSVRRYVLAARRELCNEQLGGGSVGEGGGVGVVGVVGKTEGAVNVEGSWKAWLSEGAGVTWKKIKPHTEGTETQSFSEHRGELTLAERAQRVA